MQFLLKVVQIVVFIGVAGFASSIGGEGYAPAVAGLVAASLVTGLIYWSGRLALWLRGRFAVVRENRLARDRRG